MEMNYKMYTQIINCENGDILTPKILLREARFMKKYTLTNDKFVIVRYKDNGDILH
jgi:hypothetical protein